MTTTIPGKETTICTLAALQFGDPARMSLEREDGALVLRVFARDKEQTSARLPLSHEGSATDAEKIQLLDAMIRMLAHLLAAFGPIRERPRATSIPGDGARPS